MLLSSVWEGIERTYWARIYVFEALVIGVDLDPSVDFRHGRHAVLSLPFFYHLSFSLSKLIVTSSLDGKNGQHSNTASFSCFD